MQYNVQKSRLGVMVPLLEKEEQVDIIALQEPWINLNIQVTYCPTNSRYTPVFPRAGRARTCFLVHKDIPTSKWSQTPEEVTPET